MAQLNFFTQLPDSYNLLGGGSGLCFFSSNGWGNSISVGDYQGSTYVGDGAGVVQGPLTNNTQFVAASSVNVNGTGPLSLVNICNFQVPLHIQFYNSTPVQVTNATLRITDRGNYTLPPSSVVTKVAEVISPYVDGGPNNSGDLTWITPEGTGIVVDLANSPGLSGWQSPANGAGGHSDTYHDWYICVSQSPSTIASKLTSLYVTLEYL